MAISREQEEILIKNSIEAAPGAYVPYSDFHVGACVLGEDGNFYTGFNIENVSYGATTCGEQAAVISMLTNSSCRKIKALAVAAGNSCDSMPCGICRQFLCEFVESPEVPIYSVAMDGRYMVKPFSEVMPYAFMNFEKDGTDK